MNDKKKTARIAGVWYLAFIILGAFSIMFVDNNLTISGDAAATLENLRANTTLFIFGIIAYIAGYVCFIFVVNNLGKLFKPINNRLTMFMRITVYTGVAFALACKVVQIIAVTASNEKFLTFYETGTAAAVIFWGLWLLPLGLLTLKSNLIPKILGVLLFGVCAANLADLSIHFLAPNTPETALNVCYIIEMLGEFGLVLWLLFKGVKADKMLKYES